MKLNVETAENISILLVVTAILWILSTVIFIADVIVGPLLLIATVVLFIATMICWILLYIKNTVKNGRTVWPSLFSKGGGKKHG